MSLIDYYAPRFQFQETHKIHIFASEAKIMNTILTHEATHDPLIQKMLVLRALPELMAKKLGFSSKEQAPFGMDSFTVLGQDHHKELAFGLIGKFWRPSFGLIRPNSAADFYAFHHRGVAKLVLNYRLECVNPLKQEVCLTTQTRIYCPDLSSLIFCSAYWLAIRLGSGFIRRRMLKNIKHQAEAN